MAGYKGILFDMDGVLVDSEPLFHKAVNIMVERCGAAPITEEENNRYLLGTTVEETWIRVKELRDVPQTPEELLAGYNEVVKEVLRSDLVPRPGVKDLIAEAQRRGLPIAVASSSLREWVNLKLSVIGLTDAFAIKLGGDDIENGKPAPDIYIKAAGLIGLEASECIAIEDSPIGLAAASSSGAYTICTLTDSTRHLDLSAADVIIENLEEFDYGLLAEGS
ncbi:MAG: HAD family phosphatase [Chloroflexi bacterium]|nr:HAD family phosphatase [Chloroflexota bacterium]